MQSVSKSKTKKKKSSTSSSLPVVDGVKAEEQTSSEAPSNPLNESIGGDLKDDWYTAAEMSEVNERIFSWLKSHPNQRPTTESAFEAAVKPFCQVRQFLRPKDVLDCMQQLELFKLKKLGSDEIIFDSDKISLLNVPKSGTEVALVLENILQQLLKSQQPRPSTLSALKDFIKPMCELRRSIEPRELLDEWLMAEFVQLQNGGLVFNEAKMFNKPAPDAKLWKRLLMLLVLMLLIAPPMLDKVKRFM